MYESAPPYGPLETHYGHGFVATSHDGVHFVDWGAFNAEVGSVGWFKCMVHRVADDPDGNAVWVMNHGTAGKVTGPDPPAANMSDDRGCPAGTSQCLRWLVSHDLLNWTYMYTNHPDPQYYANGRWDHAYVQEDATRGGFIAFPVATPLGSPGPGVQRSADGLNWTVERPVTVRYEGVQPTPFEFGGSERMPNGRFYMIGGGGGPATGAAAGYSMWTLRSDSDDVAGPYAPDPGAFRLSGQGGWAPAGKPPSFNQALAVFARNYDVDTPSQLAGEQRRRQRPFVPNRNPSHGDAAVASAAAAKAASPLVSQYMVMPYTADCGAQRSLAGGGHVWLLPFRKPMVDAGDHLRLAYWEGNDALKGDTLAVPATMAVGAGQPAQREVFFPGSQMWDMTRGVVVTGRVTATAAAVRGGATVPVTGAIGFAFAVNGTTSRRCAGCPWDLGPDIGWDRPGNDYNCYTVAANSTPADCAADCQQDPRCLAWTHVRASKGTRDASDDASAGGPRGLPCAHGKPLAAPYCTLKSPVPSELVRSAEGSTGLPNRSASWLDTNGSTVTRLLLGVGADGDPARAVTVDNTIVSSNGVREPPVVRDVNPGAFKCGANVTCSPATVTGLVPEQEYAFVLLARHGTFELYVGTAANADVADANTEPLFLVQTHTFGTYPVASARVGLAADGGASAAFTDLQALAMTLDPMPAVPAPTG